MSPVDPDQAPLEILPGNFHEDALAAVRALSKTLETNTRRSLAGHPPVPCQLTAPQAEAVVALISGFSLLHHLKGPDSHE